MTDLPTPGPGLGRSLMLRLRLATAAQWWERVWPAAGLALCVVGLFAVAALFDLLPLLPGPVHAGVLLLFALGLVAAIVRGVRTAGGGARPDQTTARRRIELASELSHRPLAALADRPSAPLDGEAAALWAAHQRRMAALLRRLRVGWPAAGLSRHDPWGVRSVIAILLLLGAIDAGADWRERTQRALAPRFDGGAAAVATSFDLWVTPPEYTGLAPQFLRAGETAAIKVPTGSILLAQVHGGAAPTLMIDRDSHEFAVLDKENFRFQATLTSGRQLTLSQSGTVLGRWPIEIIPDNPPAIAFARPPSATSRQALRLDYKASDDYGVESVKAAIRREGGKPDEVLELELPLPGLHLKDAAATSYHDLTPNPWAGLPVEITLSALDARNQAGNSATVKMVLPERVFRNPVARAIIDQRKELAKDPGNAAAVVEILGDLNTRPVLYRDDPAVFLALRLSQDQLRRDHGKETIAAIEQLLWDTALRVEDGNMSVAERDLRRIQQQLQDALAKGASDAEVERLMSELRSALDRYLQALAQEQKRNTNESATPVDPSRVLSGRDLQRMLDRARDLAQSGARDEARQLLSQLQDMLENLRTARPGQMQRGSSQAQQMMRGMQDLMQRQQKLLDKSFRAQQQGQSDRDGQPGRSGQPGQQSDQQQGDNQADSGQPGGMDDDAGEQEALRHQLGDMMQRLGEGMGDIPEPFGRAERAMHDAAGALQQNRPGAAIGPQTEALDQLQQAARDFARQMQQRLGDTGQPNGDDGTGDRDTPERAERDPFGRPLSNNGTYDLGYVKIPDAGILQRSRQILDELRRRAGERTRPAIELDYIDRLLKRF